MRFVRFLIAAICLSVLNPYFQHAAAKTHTPTACPKIVGGCAADKAEWPALGAVRLGANGEQVAFYFCGGTVIAEDWVLTAAHCLQDYVDSLRRNLPDSKSTIHHTMLQVVFGAEDLRQVQPEQVFDVERVVIHGTYLAALNEALKLPLGKARNEALATIAQRVGHDIALLKLKTPWSGETQPLALQAESEPKNGDEVRVAGFGDTKYDPYAKLKPESRADGQGEVFAGSPTLLQTLLPTVSVSDCAARYPDSVIGGGQICAGLERGGHDSCQGDSGGPLVAGAAEGAPRQVGVVSWGYRCAEAKAYGVCTRVSQFSDWIQTYTGPLRGAPVLDRTDVLTATQLERALAQLRAALGDARGKVRIGVRGGNRVRLGDKVVFEAQSNISGQLIILDIDADRKVTLLYPNEYTANSKIGRIQAGGAVQIPGPDYPGFTAFEARTPLGTGYLIALVAPMDFDIERFAASLKRNTKGFAPVNDPPNYLMQIIRQIEVYLGLTKQGGGALPSNADNWGYAITPYEIAP